MEVMEFIKAQIEGADMGIKRAMETLTQEEIAWQPKSGANSIGLILFHVYKAEDMFIHQMLQQKPTLWETGKWYDKLGLPATEEGAHFEGPEQVDAFKVPKLQAINDYGAAVRKDTLAYVGTLKPADLDKKIEMRFGPMPLAMVINILVSHAAQHTGEISYIRGLKRGMDK
ncbi:MAG: DinB family protein [Dehalococcoidales bacterium]|nr:DinB family protein [Dehalococcoidales bacterium]